MASELTIGILRITNDGITVNGEPVHLTKRPKAIFTRIAQAQGEYVPRHYFVVLDDIKNVYSLSVHIHKIREEFEKVTGENVILSTIAKNGVLKKDRKDGYALNMKVLEA